MRCFRLPWQERNDRLERTPDAIGDIAHRNFVGSEWWARWLGRSVQLQEVDPR
jgi:hypothetical protein